MPKLGFHSLSMWVSYLAGRPSGWQRRVSSSFAQAARAAFPFAPEALMAAWFQWSFPMELQGATERTY